MSKREIMKKIQPLENKKIELSLKQKDLIESNKWLKKYNKSIVDNLVIPKLNASVLVYSKDIIYKGKPKARIKTFEKHKPLSNLDIFEKYIDKLL